MKFKDLAIGARFKYDNLECIKATPHRYFYTFNDKEYFTKMYETLTKVELITKCSNCKHYTKDCYGEDYKFYYCSKIKVYYPDGVECEFKEDPETFSCSLFENIN